MHAHDLDIDAPFDGAVAQSTQTARRPFTRHPALVRALHWLTVLAMVAAAGSVLIRDTIETPAFRVALMDIHKQAGLFILLALILRLAIRLKKGMADNAGDMPKLMHIAATGAHIALYGALLVLPVLGWAVCNAHDVQLKLLGVIPLPNIVEADSDLADTLTDNHVLAAWGMLALIVAHIAAALWHHFGRKDGVLLAMLPKEAQAK